MILKQLILDFIYLKETLRKSAALADRRNYRFTITVIVTCLNSLWRAVRSIAAARGRFHWDVKRLSTLKAAQNTAGTISVADGRSYISS